MPARERLAVSWGCSCFPVVVLHLITCHVAHTQGSLCKMVWWGSGCILERITSSIWSGSGSQDWGELAVYSGLWVLCCVRRLCSLSASGLLLCLLIAGGERKHLDWLGGKAMLPPPPSAFGCHKYFLYECSLFGPVLEYECKQNVFLWDGLTALRVSLSKQLENHIHSGMSWRKLWAHILIRFE